MARAKPSNNNRLEEAIAILIQNQSAFLARIADVDRVNSDRFARIESILLDHGRIRAEHTRILHSLPDAVRDKPGFKTSRYLSAAPFAGSLPSTPRQRTSTSGPSIRSIPRPRATHRVS